jgi:hypothetical protein
MDEGHHNKLVADSAKERRVGRALHVTLLRAFEAGLMSNNRHLFKIYQDILEEASIGWESPWPPLPGLLNAESPNFVSKVQLVRVQYLNKPLTIGKHHPTAYLA